MKVGCRVLIKPILSPYIFVADMLVKTFGEDCEVVLHDLSDPQHSVVYVANDAVTGRKIGESFDQLVKQVLLSDSLQDNYVANYYFTARNGKRIRSSTLLIKSESGTLEGALCINLDTSRIAQQIDFLKTFLPESAIAKKQTLQNKESEEKDHISNMVTSLIDNIIFSRPLQEFSREDRVEIVRFMDMKGIFLMKGSVDQVAEKLGVNKVTVYSYLDEVRGKR